MTANEATTETSEQKKKPLTPAQSALASSALSDSGIEKLIYSLAMRYRRPGLDVEDLVQTGCEGVLQAARVWDPAGGSSFQTFAALRIRDALRTVVGAKRKDVLVTVSFDEPIDDGKSLHDLIGSDIDIESDYASMEDSSRVRLALESLSDSDREVLSLAFADDMSDPEIALKTGTPRSTVRNRRNGALRRLGLALEGSAPDASANDALEARMAA